MDGEPGLGESGLPRASDLHALLANEIDAATRHKVIKKMIEHSMAENDAACLRLRAGECRP
jgi:hypothetical protein